MKIQIKGLTSLLLAGLFVVASLSGMVMYITPQGRVANWTDWAILGLGKHDWAAIHTNTCFLMLAVGVLHWIWNWRIFWSYVKCRSGELNLKREMILAALVSIAVVAGTILQLPPFSTVTAWNDQIKLFWANQAPAGPVPHAENFGVGRFAQTVGLSFDEAAGALESEGFEVEGPQTTIAELAEAKGVAPSDVYAAIKKYFPNVGEMPDGGIRRGMGGGMGRGMGRGMGGGMGGGQGKGSEPGRDQAPDSHRPDATAD